MPNKNSDSDAAGHRSPGAPLATTPSASVKETSRLLPQLSFRFMLTVVTIVAGIAFAARLSTNGSAFATAIMYSVATVAITFGLFAALFLLAWIPAILGRDGLEDVNLGNPFSTDQLPPQVLPPRDPGT